MKEEYNETELKERAEEQIKNPTKVRFMDAPWYKQVSQEEALLIGSGGINSNVAVLLSSLGLPFTIMDGDTVETTNLGAQFFTTSQQGLNKVDAIKYNCGAFTHHEDIVAIPEFFNENSMIFNIVFLGLDNMGARKLAFEKWLEYLNEADEDEKADFILIDGRLLAEDYQIYTVTSDEESIKQYKESLFEDSEVEEEPCSYKATRFASWGIASDIVSIFVNYLTNKFYEDDVREIPTKIVKSIPSFYLNIK